MHYNAEIQGVVWCKKFFFDLCVRESISFFEIHKKITMLIAAERVTKFMSHNFFIHINKLLSDLWCWEVKKNRKYVELKWIEPCIACLKYYFRKQMNGKQKKMVWFC